MPRQYRRSLTRRQLLRSAALGGAGLASAYLLGCSDGDGGAAPTATAPLATATPQAAGELRWQRLAAGGGPSARRDHSLVTDGERLYVFGGRDPEPLGDLWIYDIAAGTWTRADPQQGFDPPRARFGHNAVWAPGHTQEKSRMLVFGGQAGAGFFNDLWSYDPIANTWNIALANVNPAAAPEPRYGAAAAVVFGGQLWVTHGFTSSGRFDDTWSFSYLEPTGWTETTRAGARPIERCLVRAVADSFGPHGARLLMFGGQTTDTPYLGDTWALEVDGWREITGATGPSPRNLYAMAFDDASSSLLLFGGRTANGPAGDLWLLDQDEVWHEMTVAGEVPSPRFSHDAAWVGTRRALYVFGGSDGASDLDELWVLSPA